MSGLTTQPGEPLTSWAVAARLADETIGLFLESRDRHRYDETAVRLAAVAEVADGASMNVRDALAYVGGEAI